MTQTGPRMIRPARFEHIRLRLLRGKIIASRNHILGSTQQDPAVYGVAWMKYFDEEKMREVRDDLEKEILQWPGVSTREMMGCLCYLHGKNMIAFLVTDGIVISKLSEQEEKDLSKLSKKTIFKMGGKAMRRPVWELKTRENLRTVMPFLKKATKPQVGPKK